MAIPWWGYVVAAGLAWGVYVPLIFYGGTELTTRPGTVGGRLASILCVGVAYMVMAVAVPLVLMATRDDAKPEWKLNGLVFSGLAGIAGAVGAICVIFASKAAVDTAKLEGIDPATYRVYIAPLIFCLAPLVNTLLSLVWHPKPGAPWHFGFETPTWHLPLGIVFVAAGTFLVLYSKEAGEAQKGGGPKPPVTTAGGGRVVTATRPSPRPAFWRPAG